MNNILQLLFSLSILVFVHELGHFVMARLFGARVEKFYLFFNPWFSLLKWRSPRSGTVYGLGWLPLGGYCQIAGMVDESMDTEELKNEPKPDEFRSKTTWQRLLIMIGGILFNLILAFVLYISIAFVWGDKRLDTHRVADGWVFSPVAQSIGFADGDIIYSIDGQEQLDALDPHLVERMIEAKEVVVLRSGRQVAISVPADMMARVLREGKGFASIQMPFVLEDIANRKLRAAGAQEGDRVIAINGAPTGHVQAVFDALLAHKGQRVKLSVLRGADTLAIPAEVDESGKLGVMLRTPYELYPIETISYSFWESIPAGFNSAIATLTSYAGSLKMLFTKEGAKSLGGLGTMARLFPEEFSWQVFWGMTAFLSIILAVMNILPIPALDGGHIIFILVEMTTGRKLSDKAMGYLQMGGMIFLLLLMLYANGNDVYRYLIK